MVEPGDWRLVAGFLSSCRRLLAVGSSSPNRATRAVSHRRMSAHRRGARAVRVHIACGNSGVSVGASDLPPGRLSPRRLRRGRRGSSDRHVPGRRRQGQVRPRPHCASPWRSTNPLSDPDFFRARHGSSRGGTSRRVHASTPRSHSGRGSHTWAPAASSISAGIVLPPVPPSGDRPAAAAAELLPELLPELLELLLELPPGRCPAGAATWSCRCSTHRWRLAGLHLDAERRPLRRTGQWTRRWCPSSPPHCASGPAARRWTAVVERVMLARAMMSPSKAVVVPRVGGAADLPEHCTLAFVDDDDRCVRPRTSQRAPIWNTKVALDRPWRRA